MNKNLRVALKTQIEGPPRMGTGKLMCVSIANALEELNDNPTQSLVEVEGYITILGINSLRTPEKTLDLQEKQDLWDFLHYTSEHPNCSVKANFQLTLEQLQTVSQLTPGPWGESQGVRVDFLSEEPILNKQIGEPLEVRRLKTLQEGEFPLKPNTYVEYKGIIYQVSLIPLENPLLQPTPLGTVIQL